MSDEEWRPIVGYEGRYSVSSQGFIRSEDRITLTSTGPRKFKGRMLNWIIGNDGRPYVTLTKSDTTRKRTAVARTVLLAFVGPCPKGMECLHYDDNPLNNDISNLRWGTSSENMHDRVRNGRHPATLKERCIRGHPLSGDNLLPAITRQCKVCSRAHTWRRSGKSTFEDALTYWEGVYG